MVFGVDSTFVSTKGGSSFIPEVLEKTVIEEKTEFSLFVDSVFEDKRVNVIKVIRQLTSFDLKTSKNIIESLPHVVLEKLSKQDAENGKKLLEEAGAVARIN